MNYIVALVIVILIGVISISLVLNIGVPVLQVSQDANRFQEYEKNMRFLNNLIQDIAQEGVGASRVYRFDVENEDIEIMSDSNSIQLKFVSDANIQEYLSRKISGNLFLISGNDVSCKTDSNISMENGFLKIELQKVSGIVNTSRNILSMTEKLSNKNMQINDSSIIINDDPSTSAGTGFSKLLRTGNGLPLCTTQFYVNSSVQYDIFYTLFSGADFVVVEIKNVR